jgi:sugar lactone lactonase YvrE
MQYMNYFLKIILSLVLALGAGHSALAQGIDRGKMKVEFLYSIESVGGRGDNLRSPQDIFYDRKAEELYIADASGRGILVYDRNGAFLQELAFDTAIGSATMVATDGEGHIYVGYNRSFRVGVLDFRGQPLGSYELPGIVDLPAADVRPMYFAAGENGAVYALKNKGGLVKIDPFGEEHQALNPTGENAPNMVYGMTVDSRGRFIFTDMRPGSVVIYDPALDTFQRFGSAGILYGQLSRPQGVTTDDAGHIFVTSLVRNKVLCYDSEGNFIEEFGGIGRNYGRFYMPTKIVSDGKDRLYVLETGLKRIQVFRIGFPDDSGKKPAVALDK